MGRNTYLIRRGGAYSARLRVPLDLIEVVGRKELVKALGTSDPAEAKRRVLAVVSAWQSRFEALRHRDQMTESAQSDLVWSFYSGILEYDERRRAALPDEDDLDAELESAVDRVQREMIDITDPLQALDVSLDLLVMKDRRKGSKSVDAKARRTKLQQLRQHLNTGESALIQHEIDSYLNLHGLIISRSERVDLMRQMIRAEIEALQRTLERDKGDYGGQPADQLIQRVRESHSTTDAPGESIMAVFEIFARENVAGVASDRINQMRRDIGLLVQIAEDRCPVSKIDKKLVRDWKALLIRFPVKATEMIAFRGMNMREIVAANEKFQKPVLADRSVNRYLSSLSAFCKWAVNNGYLELNPVTGMSLAKEHNSKTLPLTTDQMTTLFKSPLFTGCQSDSGCASMARKGNVLIRDHRYWVPLIMLYSGARPGEIGQLTVSDVRQEQGRWIMHITTEGEGKKRTKTKGSMRVVPLHDMLIKLGLIDYHVAQLEAQNVQLFPRAVRNARGQMMADYSREFSRYLIEIGIKQGRGVSLYSFRHGTTDALRRAGYLDEQIGLILGHGQATTTGRYGILSQGVLEQRAQLIDAIDYPGLDLSHLVAG